MNKKQNKEEVRRIRENVRITGLFVLLIFLFMSLGFSSEQEDSESELSIGDAINYFDLIGDAGEVINVSDLAEKEISAIFVFSNCHICEKNIPFWKRIAAILKNKLSVYGIILNELSEIVYFSKSAQLTFELYCPNDQNKFRRKFGTKQNLAQTILYRNNRILYKKDGTLEMDDYFNLVELIKGDEE